MQKEGVKMKKKEQKKEPEQKVEQVKETNEKAEAKIETEAKKGWTINKVTIWRILAYFALYSFVGFVIETAYGFLTQGKLESRQSFLYGPFCGIYGVGAVLMIVALHRLDRTKKWKLFVGGFVVGSALEYFMSLIGEILFHVKWWDYSGMFLSIGGRICLLYSIFWGILAIYLVGHLNPMIDRWLDKIQAKLKPRTSKIIISLITIFLFVDFCITGLALKAFNIRMIVEHDIDVADKESVVSQYHAIYDNEKRSEFIHRFFGDRKMIRTFPNLKIRDKNGNMVYFGDILSDIQSYYFKINLNLKG